jgi:hypothetical protein
MRRTLQSCLALLLAAAPAAVRAEEGHAHEGFYAHLQLGGTYLSAEQGAVHDAGPGVALGLAAGGFVRPNLALFAMLTFHVALDPQVDGGGSPASVSNVEDDAFGAGLAYYLEPLNAYAAAAVTGSSVQVFDKNDNRLAGSNTGLGFQVMAGKEWWVGRAWGMGLAGELTGAWMKDGDDPTVRWHSFTYSLLLSATYD